MPGNDRVYTPRAAPCTHCGDAVNVVADHLPRIFGLRLGRAPVMRLEHADPAPDGAVFDPVDGACGRRPLRPGLT